MTGKTIATCESCGNQVRATELTAEGECGRCAGSEMYIIRRKGER